MQAIDTKSTLSAATMQQLRTYGDDLQSSHIAETVLYLAQGKVNPIKDLGPAEASELFWRYTDLQ